mgnify:CR=1 FL=1
MSFLPQVAFLIILAAAFGTSVAQPYPLYPIEVVTTVDPSTGVADSLDRDCAVAGIVHGINIRPSGLQFTIINSDINDMAQYGLPPGESK